MEATPVAQPCEPDQALVAAPPPEALPPSPAVDASMQTTIGFEMVDPLLLDPMADNINEMDDEAFALLKESIRELGFIDPLEAVPLSNGRYLVVGGAHRLRAAQAAGMLRVPVVTLRGPQWEEEDARFFAACRLNAVHGRPSVTKLASAVQRLSPKYGEDALRQFMGFRIDAWGVLLKQMRDGLKRMGVSESALKDFDKGKARAKTANDLTTLVNSVLSKQGSTLTSNFVTFGYGEREVLYTLANESVYATMKAMTEKVARAGVDINAVWEKAMEGWEARSADVLERKQPAAV